MCRTPGCRSTVPSHPPVQVDQRTHSPQLETTQLRGPSHLVHTFPKPYDDDYLDRSMITHITNEAPSVDNSRTLGTSTFAGGHE